MTEQCRYTCIYKSILNYIKYENMTVFLMNGEEVKIQMSVVLSICIVVYENYEEAKKAINSMEKCTSHDLKKKIYVVDNGANVSEKTLVEDFKMYIRNIRDAEYIDAGENLGFGKGHNKILNCIDSEYHAIVNPDILFCEDAFSKIVNWMNQHNEIGMTIPLITDENGNRQDVYRKELTLFDMFNRMFLKGLFKRRFNEHIMRNMDYTRPFQVPFGQGSFLVIRTKLFKNLGGFDDNFFMYVEDADLCKRVNQVSKLMYYPKAKVIHRWERGSHSNKTLFKYHVESTKYYFKKWGWKIV